MFLRSLFTRRFTRVFFFALLFMSILAVLARAGLRFMPVSAAPVVIEADLRESQAEADLSLINTDSADPVMMGEELTYLLSITNNGPENATNVTLFDTLPQPLGSVTFVSATPSQGSCLGNDSVVTCYLGTLANGETATVAIVVIPTTTGRLINVANASTAAFDPNVGNNIAYEYTVASGEFDLFSVSPSYGLNNVPTVIYIDGSGFEEPLTVSLGATALDVTYVDHVLIVAIVPAGLIPGSYDLTVTAPGGELTLENIYDVMASGNSDDLLSSPEWLWTNPIPMRVGVSESGVGLTLQHFGGEATVDEVAVDFRLYDAENNFLEVLGRGVTPALPPYATERTEPLIWEPEVAGEYRVCATMDPDDEVPETDEGNNLICRDIVVLPPNEDNEPPEVDSFLINDGQQTTISQAASLDVSATDYPIPGASGVRALKFIEFEYVYGAHRWVPVQRSEWLTYDVARVDYPWSFIPTYGIRYMEAWAVDDASNMSSTQSDNISLAPGVAIIDLLPVEQSASVAQGGVVLYRIYVEEGQTLQATLTPVSGDPDLYIWAPDGALYHSTNQTGIETVVIQAEERGTYQLEVHGYTDAEYHLIFGTSMERVTLASLSTSEASASRAMPENPAVALDDWPEYYDIELLLGEPSSPPSQEVKIYLPMTIR